MQDGQFTQTREDLAALKERSDHSQESRSYLTMRIDDLWGMVNGSNGLSDRLARQEEKVSQFERRERRLYGWLIAHVPLVAAIVQYLLKQL